MKLNEKWNWSSSQAFFLRSPLLFTTPVKAFTKFSRCTFRELLWAWLAQSMMAAGTAMAANTETFSFVLVGTEKRKIQIQIVRFFAARSHRWLWFWAFKGSSLFVDYFLMSRNFRWPIKAIKYSSSVILWWNFKDSISLCCDFSLNFNSINLVPPSAHKFHPQTNKSTSEL